MKKSGLLLGVAYLLFVGTPLLLAQPSTDSLISHSLNYVDFPPYVQQGPLPAMHPRLGIYFNDFPGDSVKLLTHGVDTFKADKIWHLAPHWSADSAGLMNGDIVLRVDGKTLRDSVYGGTDVLNTRLMAMKVGDTMQFQIIRNGRIMMVPVPLNGGHRIPPTKYWDYAGLGPVRQSTWMERTLAEKGLTSWADSIAKQIAAIADFDFCDRPFTKNPSPFRLNAVTYLDHHPTRVGALSRLIDQSVWDSLSRGQGLDGAIDAAALELGCLPKELPTLELPKTVEELKTYFAETQALLDKAYAPVKSEIAPLSWQVSELLNTDTNWEDPVDSTQDPVKQLAVRTRAEDMLVHVLGDASKVDYPDLIAAARRLSALADTNWVKEFALAVTRSLKSSGKPIRPLTNVPGVDGTVIMEWDTPDGRCVIGGAGPNRYYGDFAMIIDIGGDDVYDLPPCKPGTFRYVADLGGNDLYNGYIASGVGCVDVLVDCHGNDTYRGDRWTQGAGCLGVGILADFGGDDIYTAHWCAQGAAMLGIGLLYDRSGSDHYISDVYSQGFAYSFGFGILLECEGNDSYRAGWKYPDDRWPNRAHVGMSQGYGFGLRPWSTGVGTDGGIGLLSDLQGDDVYDAGIFSQGGSYWYGLGILHDRRGADRYSAGQYSQGSGIHLSFGALLDDSGDDSYDAYAWLEQGNAHDWSSGCLEDWEGKDTYRCSGAGQGCGFFNSFAYLLDSHGDDRYYCKMTDTTDSQGGGNWIGSRNAGSLGMLIDLGKGDDWYSDERIKQGEVVVKSAKGIAWDDGAPEKKK